jgi:C-terminal processing protease CtpA/Prc
MMRPLGHVTTLGAPSRGSMGNPQPFPVTPEYSVWIPTRREVAPDGKRIEGHGVAPEIALDAPRDAFDGRDPVFERAIERLAK